MAVSRSLKVAVAQYPITAFSDVESWKNHMELWVQQACAEHAELLVFPEYGAMELVSVFPENIQRDLIGQLHALQELLPLFIETYTTLANQFQCTIVSPSFPVKLTDYFVNRAHVFSPKGLVGHQDKWFMTRFENEEWGITAGKKELSLFKADWGNFGIQTCYDVEFGIGSHHLCKAGAHLIVAPSCTETIRGATRVHIGARARALENQCYAAVSQTVGNAEWSPAVDINYGQAAFYTTPDTGMPEEGILALGIPQRENWLYHELDFGALSMVRNEGQVLNFNDSVRTDQQFDGEMIQVKKHFL
jgi:predicted amidohydrolase